MSWAIVTDSSSAISPRMAHHWGVRVVDLHVIRNAVDYPDSLTTCHDVLCEHNAEIPSTAAATVDELSAAYQAALDQADYVVAIHMSSQLSSLFAMAQQAQQACDPTGSRIILVDSQTAGSALGLIVRHTLHFLAQAERTPEQVHAMVDSLCASSRMTVGMVAMTYAAHGGRIDPGLAQQALNLPLHPTMVMDNGKMSVYCMSKTLKAQRREMLHYIEDALDHRPAVCAVEYVDDPDAAHTLAHQLHQAYGQVPWVTQASPSTALHVGPGGIAISALLCQRDTAQSS